MSVILERLNKYHDMGSAYTWSMKYEWVTKNGVMGLYSYDEQESLWLLVWDGTKLLNINSYWDWGYGYERAEAIAAFAGVFNYAID